MLKVRTKLGSSTIAGTGLFADQFIAKDTIIWQYSDMHDKFYTQSEFDKIEGLDKEFLNTYCFRFNNIYYLCIDNSRFFNHSDTPNCYSSEFNLGSLGYTRALRDIEIGEELTDDYLGFGLNEEDKKWNKQY